jgi:hypothetical protein
MKNLDIIGDDLFNKIRGRFKNVTIGDAQGQITNEPAKARFFDFEYTESTAKGKVSVSISEDEGLTVIYSNDFIANESDTIKNNWYNFLKELRVFARKRLLNFDTRDITKTNLNKRDYKFLANNRAGDGTMTESKLYGTSRISYQNVGEARIMIRHTENINQETATGRTQKIGKIYIESADGERFRYPFKHLSGARAMARHVAEGGNAYDDFGKHIVGLSEEMSKLRKFKNYMGRSAVMAESLAGYVDVVKERISTVKKTIESLQKPAYYKETFEAFETPVMEDVPSDVAENWIDQLTIRQFNEELADVFPYIYKLVSEATKATELGPDELDEVAGPDKCWPGHRKVGTQAGTGKNKGKRVNKCKKIESEEEIQIEQGFEEMMGQFGESSDCDHTCPKSCPDCGGTGDPEKYQAAEGETNETQEGKVGTMALFVTDQDGGEHEVEVEVEIKNGKPEIVANTLPGPEDMLYWDDADIQQQADEAFRDGDIEFDEGNAYSGAVAKAKMNGKKKGDKIQGPDGDEITIEKEQKTPLPEFILSYFDRETGQFPKGETAILTMIEKDYGEQYISPAKQFIEMINNKVAEMYGYKEAEQDTEYLRMRELAGL